MWGISAEKVMQSLNEVAHSVVGNGVGFDVHYWGIDDCHYDNLPHMHSFFEVCHVVGGTGLYVDGEEKSPLAAGTMFLSRPGIRHQIRSQAGLEILFVGFTVQPGAMSEWDELYAQLAGDRVSTVLMRAEESPTALLWRSLVLSCAGTIACPRPVTQSIATALLTSFLPTFCTLSESPTPHRLRTTHPIVKRTMQFVRDNLSRPLSLQGVAQYLHVSPRHLSRLVKQTTGMGYTSFVQQERMARARQLLAETTLSVKDITEVTGFSSVHYFTRLFTRESGIPPVFYRRQHNSLIDVQEI